MNIVVSADRPNGHVDISTPDGTADEQASLRSCRPIGRAIIASFSQASATAITRACAQQGRGWAYEPISDIYSILRALTILGVSATPQTVCARIAQLVADQFVALGRARYARATIQVRQNGLSTDVPEFSPRSSVLLAVGGLLYALRPAEGPSDPLENMRQELQTQANSYQVQIQALGLSLRDEVERRVAEAEGRMRQLHPIPPLALSDVQAGLRVHHTSSGVAYYLPFDYRPRYLIHPGQSSTRFILSDAAVEALHRSVFIMFHALTRGGWNPPRLVKPELNGDFEHYHVRCWGTLVPSELITEVPASLYPLRDRLEAELEVINGASLAERAPDDLIPYTELTEMLGEEIERWDSRRSPRRRAQRPVVVPTQEPQEENAEGDETENGETDTAAEGRPGERRPGGWRI